MYSVIISVLNFGFGFGSVSAKFRFSRSLINNQNRLIYFQFLRYTKSKGNDLSTPNPPHFPGLKPGDHWALCASRWLGVISHKMSLITIFGHKYEIKNFIKKFNIFHKQNFNFCRFWFIFGIKLLILTQIYINND